MIDKPCILTKIINEHSGTSSKVILRTSKEGGSNNSALSDRSFVLNVKINGLGIPGNYGFGLIKFLYTIQTFITVGNDGSAWDDVSMVVPFGRIFIIIEFKVDFFELFDGIVFELTGVDFVESVLRGSTHTIGDVERFIVYDGRGLLAEEVLGAMFLEFEHSWKGGGVVIC